jgi:hypothetical protein
MSIIYLKLKKQNLFYHFHFKVLFSNELIDSFLLSKKKIDNFCFKLLLYVFILFINNNNNNNKTKTKTKIEFIN